MSATWSRVSPWPKNLVLFTAAPNAATPAPNGWAAARSAAPGGPCRNTNPPQPAAPPRRQPPGWSPRGSRPPPRPKKSPPFPQQKPPAKPPALGSSTGCWAAALFPDPSCCWRANPGWGNPRCFWRSPAGGRNLTGSPSM